MESDLDYGRVLSSSKQLGVLLSRQLEVLHFTAEQVNSSLGDLVRIIDKVFSYGQSSSRLQQLTLNVDAHPDSLLSTRHLIRRLKKYSNVFHYLFVSL